MVKSPHRILYYEMLGFLLIILLSWVDEIFVLPYVLFGGTSPSANWREAAVETVVVLGVGILVVLTTRKLLERLVYLEGYIRLCAWCRKIHWGGQWIPFEQYASKSLNTPVTHSICEDCAGKMGKEL